MRVLVTGAFGYLGLAVVQRLAREHEVVVHGRAPRKSAAQAVYEKIPADVQVLPEGDVADLPYQHVDAIVHLAGGGASGGAVADVGESSHDNLWSAIHVASCAPPRARRILASSIYAYGIARPLWESTIVAPTTLYGMQKVLAEAAWRQEGGMCLRFSHIYGVGSGVDFGRTGVTEKLARSLTGGDPFVVQGDGQQAIDLVHIDDACEAIARCLTSSHLPPVINIGGDEYVTIAELKAIAEGRDKVSLVDSNTCLDVNLALETLGWRPTISLKDGLSGLVEMFRELS